MRNVTNIYEQLALDEGRRTKPYQDTRGFWTCGVGHKLAPTDDHVTLWSDEKIDQTLRTDVDNAILQLSQHLPWVFQSGMGDAREGVFINMCFNMGVFGLLKFKESLFLAKTNKYVECAEELLRSEWAQQVGDRAKRLSRQMGTGEWQ